jgi:hypothetical protein
MRRLVELLLWPFSTRLVLWVSRIKIICALTGKNSRVFPTVETHDHVRRVRDDSFHSM